jgi:hypothetical protein
MSHGDWKDAYKAACTGDIGLLRYHISNGVDVNFEHAEYPSGLLVASILSCQPSAALLLLDHGANPHGTAADMSQTPYAAACSLELAVVKERLEALGARPRSRLAHLVRRFRLPTPRT